MEYCITVEIPASGNWHGSISLGWLSEMLKVILQVQSEECNAVIRLITSWSTLKYFRNDIEQSLDDKSILIAKETLNA